MNELITRHIIPFLDIFATVGIRFDYNGILWIFIYTLIIVLSIYISRYISHRVIDLIHLKLKKLRNKQRLRLFVFLLLRRLPTFVFCLLIWISTLLLSTVTWPSVTYPLWLVLALVLSWESIDVLISLVIKNKIIARTMTIIIWVIAALNILRISPKTLEALNGISLQAGSIDLSLLSLIKGAVVFIFGIWLAIYIGKHIEHKLNKSTELTPSLKVLAAKLFKAVLLIIAFGAGLDAIGIDFTALAVLSGAIGLGIGFGLQKIVSNLISGIILLTDKSIKPGDVITVGDTFGRINSLRARYVSVVVRDGREFLIPNEDLIVNQVLNWSHSNNLVRLEVRFGASYGSDPVLVRKLACQVGAAHCRVFAQPQPICHIIEFGESSINYTLRAWIEDPYNGMTNIRGDIYLALWQAFKSNGVTIPYPHRELYLHTRDKDKPILAAEQP